MKKAVLTLSLTLCAAGLVALVTYPTLAQRTFDPAAVSAERIVSIEAADEGAWALTSSGLVLFCAVADEADPKVVCFDRDGRTGLTF
ncbi:MAG: hypothetical protein WEB93_01840 [Sphingomonadales bacterium]